MSLYRELAIAPRPQRVSDPRPVPGTAMTASLETMDEDGAVSLFTARIAQACQRDREQAGTRITESLETMDNDTAMAVYHIAPGS
jgi:hypothetical protein